MRRDLILLLLTGLSASTVQAGNVFKCKDAQGNTTYQEVPCAKAEEQESHRVYERVRDTPEQTRANFRQTAQHYQEQVGPMSAYGNEMDAYSAEPIQSRSVDPELARKLADRQAALNSYRGTSEIDRLRREDARREIEQLRGQMGIPAPSPAPVAQPSRQAPVVRTGPGYTEPKTIRDQYGNQYMQPPGSTFATDPKTGKQCFVNGGFIHCD